MKNQICAHSFQVSHSDKSTFCNFLDESLQPNYWRVILVVNIALTCKGITPNTMSGRKGPCPVINWDVDTEEQP